MNFSSQYVGTYLKTYHTKVQWRDTMNYAAAIGDHNPQYFDDECKEDLIAPPMFAVAATWPVIENLPEFIETNDFPREILDTQVHYTEHLRFQRPIKPGETLSIRGRITAILPHPSGTHVVTRLEAFDLNSKPVFSEYFGVMMRGVHCSDDGQGQGALPVVPDRGAADRLRWEKKIAVDPLLPFIYDGCADIVFPIHTSKKFAHQVGLPGIILQGTATLALAVRELINREADGNSRQLKEIFCRFTDMVLPGSEIRLQAFGRHTTQSGRDLFFDVLNQQGAKAISKGYALVER
ncbi:MAG: hypothetical protein HKO68_04025 [Desulfobacterales bacterium]|nr:hypothetical protein [Desulfobacterales bacterium]